MRFSKWLLRFIKVPPRILYTLGIGPVYGRLVLLLTTTGRRSGRRRVTPLQYEEIDGAIYVASALGVRADWFRNITADPRVGVRVRSRRFSGIAEPVTDPGRVADFLQYRLDRHPRMIGAILKREGLSPQPDRKELEDYAAGRAIVIIRPSPALSERGE